MGARQEEGARKLWNRDDVGPEQDTEALRGGKGPLDKQRASALQDELTDGATLALITRQAVKPSDAWEGEKAV
jgi:hypothetical protein